MGSYTLLLMLVRFLQYKQKVIGKSAFSDLGILLVQFFYFYSEQFNYVELGISVKKDCFIKKPDPNKLLWVQDPMNPDNNVARPVYMGKIMEAFKYAYSTLLSPQNQRIGLSRLIVIDKIHDKRKKFWTKHKTPDERFNTKYVFEDERSSPERQKRKRNSDTEDQESTPKRRKIQETEPSTQPEEDSEVIEISDEEATDIVPDDPNIDVHVTKDLNLDDHVSTDSVEKDEKKPRKKRARPKKKSGKKDSNHMNGSFPKRRKLENNDSTNHSKKFNSENGKSGNQSKRPPDGQNRAKSNRKNRSNSDLKNRSDYNKKYRSQNQKKNQSSNHYKQQKSDQNKQKKSDQNKQKKSDQSKQMKTDQYRKRKKKFQKSIPASKQPVKPKTQKSDVIVLS
eukprot:TRINITY_DN3282_c0_g2_i2.p1 TRINITY_DN3282_c0_g2~~TRINITY_DN3282_c0_g2_i2.p1  ORF type:complete len:394 (+),score=104.15 TRINITY_DN3282_c0_g2_i2:397-1578(+)